MKPDAFTGTGKVFRFTLAQMLKSKANRRALIIVFLIALLSSPLFSLIQGGSGSGSSVSVVYVQNQTSLPLNGLHDYLLDFGYGDVTVETELPEDLKNEAALRLAQTADGLQVEIIGSTERSYYAAEAAASYLRRQLLLEAGVSQEDTKLLQPAGTDIVYASDPVSSAPQGAAPAADGSGISDEPTEVPSESGLSGAYTVQLGFSVLLIMISMISVSFVIRSVIEEKTSKLVDLLLVSVKPGALLLGKVLASLLYSLLYFSLMLCGAVLSQKIFGLFMDLSGVTDYLSNILKLDLAPDVLLVLLVSSLLGLLIFGILSGLSGAGCSSVEESGGAMSLCMLLIMGGYMVSIFSMITGVPESGTATILSIIPVLSMFTAPTLYMYGAVSIGTIAIGWLAELVLAFLLILLAGRVYSSLIIYKGKRLGFGQILRLAAGKEAGK